MPGASQTCGVCLKIFPTMIRLQQHQIMHNDKIYQCKECDKGFKCKYRLKYHELNHYHKAYECPICSKRFAVSHMPVLLDSLLILSILFVVAITFSATFKYS